ncbi:MAG: hypothetical protein EP329_11255 [Deltaproteobacteria bacterium]|nr:MAG: hypothetical protein EP329_11255 [Deltaproteobacteria bacterium]
MIATRVTLLAAGLALLGACPGPDPAPTPHWAEAFDTTATGALSGVWGAAPDDVWIVGGRPGVAEIHHYDGAAWSEVAAPSDADLLVWVYGFASDDVLAVGVAGTVAHWDGATWTTLDSGTDADLWGVFGFGPDDVWIVGAAPAGDTVPTLLHYDGETFSPYALDPAQNSRSATSLFKVWGIDGTLFAVGQRGLVIRWDGQGWVETPAGAKADQDFVSLWGTAADHIVAVGGRNNARLATWDGTGWTTIAPTGIGGLNAVTMSAPDAAVVGGIYGWVGTFAPESGALEREDSLTNLDIHALWDDGAGRVYAVGGRFVGTFGGVALVRTLD